MVAAQGQVRWTRGQELRLWLVLLAVLVGLIALGLWQGDFAEVLQNGSSL